MISGMWTLFLWFGLLAAAGLCYPRRPRATGALFIILGVFSIVLGFLHNPDRWLAPVGAGVLPIVMAAWSLAKYRSPDVRAKHVEYWTARA